MSDTLSVEPTIPGTETSSRKYVLLFCITTFLFWAGLYLYVPILPVYVQSSGASLTLIGTVVSAYAIPQALFRIPLGLWSDKLGRRKPLVALGIVVMALGAIGLGLSDSAWLLFLARMTTGVGAAAWVVFVVYLTAYYPARSRGRAIGLITFVQNTAVLAATAGGGFIAETLGPRQTFFIAAFFGVLALIALLPAREQPPVKTGAPRKSVLKSVITNPVLITASVLGILMQFSSYAGLFSFLPIYAAGLGATDSQLGLITMINMGFSSFGALAAIHIWEKYGHRSTIIFGAVLIGGTLLSIPLIKEIPVILAVQASFGFGRGLIMTTAMTLSIRNAPPEQQATAMGIFQAVYAVGMLFGPLLSGVIGEKFGLSYIFLTAALTNLVTIGMAFLPVLSRKYMRDNVQ